MQAVEDTAGAILETLRAEGWMVAVHNDYKLKGVFHSFWLFTHPSGVWAKGEATSDLEALQAAAHQARSRLELIHRITSEASD